jgi:hypothetical protein
LDSFSNLKQTQFKKHLKRGVCSLFSFFSSIFKKPSPLGVAAFFPGFISVQQLASSRAPMNGSLAQSARPYGMVDLNGRVFLIGSSF